MGYFEYKALNNEGKEVKGKIEAKDKTQASLSLQKQKLYPLSVKPVKTGGLSLDFALFRKLKLFQKKIDSKTLAEFSRQLGTLISVGIPYNRALEIYGKEVKDPYFQNILLEVKNKVLEGASLAKALQAFPSAFPEYYSVNVQAGERSGFLGQNLLRQADFLEEQNEISSKVKTALIYPCIMAVLGLFIVVFMIEFIVPKITPIFDQFKRALPWPTQVVLFISNILSNYPYLLLFGLLAGLIGLQVFLQKPAGKLFIHRLQLKIPVFKTLFFRLILLRFTQTLEITLRAGVELREALLIAGKSTGNSVFEKEIDEVSDLTVTQGYSLSQALKKASRLDDKFIQVVSVGEESGKLEEMLTKIAEQMKKETYALMQRYLSFLEPVIILVMALFVGFIIVAVMLPIFEINQVLQ